MSSDRLQPLHLDPSALHGLPAGWVWKKVEDATHAVPVGRKYDGKAVVPGGLVPVIDQSLSGVMGHHNDEPGVQASHTDPAFTFANHTCAMRWMTSPFSCIQNVFVLRGRQGFSTQYLYYATQGRVVLEEYKGHAPIFRSMFIPVAPLDEQRNIAHLLTGIDDRIALLRETNGTLEAIAQALFKSWFVDFDPVRSKQQGLAPAGMDEATAALFPDGFEASALGLVPKAWAVSQLGNQCKLQWGNTTITKKSYVAEGVRAFSAAGQDGYVSTAERSGVGSVISAIGTVGVVHLAHGKWTAIKNTLTAQCDDDEESTWLHFLLKLVRFPSRGSTQQFISQGDARAIAVVCPPIALRRAFGDFSLPLIERLVANCEQAQTLTTLRDTLLPRLISGQLRLPEAEAALETV